MASGAPATVTGRPGCAEVPDAATEARSGATDDAALGRSETRTADDDSPPGRDGTVTSGAPAVAAGRPDGAEAPDAVTEARSGAAAGDDGAPPAWDWVCGRLSTATSGRTARLFAGF
ncbi:hypothetical protein AORI_5420 [Amycolatopsis keratiniphila]|uniref:Uncharacterized protein n=1 Tax=Amycolatopsis keratiniphila TaxID=129921 RepID=R4TC46_9PSEU|nr:hypothetical protein AORI_5420 [Amycolatopsis keratiniphila]